MSKDVVIAGVIVFACLGLVAVAFVGSGKKKPAEPIIADNPIRDPLVTPPPSVNDLPPITDPLLANNSNPLNPPGSNPPPNFNNQPGFNPPPSFNNQPGFNPPGNNTFNPGGFPKPPAPPVQPLPPIEPPPAPAEVKTHVVAAGETLGEISMKHYGTSKYWKKIAEANKVDAADLKVGQKLTIPVVEKPAATPAPGSEPVVAAGEHTYKIKRDDSYYSIAKRELGNASRWKEIEKLNNIPSEELRVGQTIKLPAKESATTAPAHGAPGAAPAPVEGNVHVVAAGETLGDISKKHYGTSTKWKDIVKANPGVDPEGLKIGQKLKLPEIAGTPTPTNTPAPGAAPVSDSAAGDYTVKAGDTLESIALSQLGSKTATKKIIEANPGLDARKMRIGQKLKIPGKAATAPAEPLPPIGGGNSGNSGFGAPAFPGSSGFGPTTPGGSSGFRPTGPGSSSGFGTTTPGGTSGFGTTTPGGSSGFGTPPPAPSPNYPAPPAGGSTGFGVPPAPAPTSGFGSGADASGFGTSTPAPSGSAPLKP